MKRFYLIICFLMSIIGSAWGQETKTTVTMSDYTQEEKDSKSITRTSDGVSFSLINLSKIDGTKGPNAVAGTEFVVSVPENSSIKNVEFNIGGSSSAGYLRFKIYADDEIIESEHQPTDLKNCVMPYPKDGSLENTVRSLKFVVVNTDDTKSPYFYITSAKVTYTYTPVAATAISLDPTTAVLAVGKTQTLKATVSPDNATDKSVTWSSNDTGIATVDANGNVTAVAAGTAGITATSNSDGNVTATCTVVVPAVLSVGTTQKTATVANITSFSNCVITKSGQLMDRAQNGSYVIFQVTPEVSGTYSFTSKIATPQDGETVELYCGGTSLGVKNITPSGNANDWDTGEKYTWTCTLEQGQTYDIKVVCAHDGEAFYTANIFDMNIVKMVYPWTVSGKTLTINSMSGSLVPGGMSTADDGLNDIPGLHVTLTGDASKQWEIRSNAYGKVNPEVKNNIPTSGTYIVLEPTQSGTVTIMTQALNGSSYYLVDSNGVQVGDAYSHNSADAAYEFTRELTAGNTYYYYIKGRTDNANLGFSTITYTPYPWTIKGNTLTISTAETVYLTTNTSDNLPGLGVTFNATSENKWSVGNYAWGTEGSTDANAIPTSGTYLTLTPSESGTVTILNRTWGGSYTLIDSKENKRVVEAASNNEGIDFPAQYELEAGNVYYYFIPGAKKNLAIKSITYELTQETTKKFNVSDFNYERGAHGIAGAGLNREIGGFTFTYNPSGKDQFVKANELEKFFFRVNESGTLVIAPDANNSGAKITHVVLKGIFSKLEGQDVIEAITGLTASATEGSCETAIDIANGTLTVTCAGTSAVNITTEALSNAFTVSSIEVTTDRDVTFERITPTITFDSSEISYAVGSASFVNGVTVTPANFRLAYSITSNGTGSSIKEYTESDGDGVAGTVTVGEAAGTEIVTASFAGNKYYNAVTKTYTLKIIAEELSVANEQVVYAVNTDKLYSFVTDGAGKVTYTALDGNVNTVESTNPASIFTYSSSDENLIKVNAETGELSLGDNWTAGKAVTITATSAAGQTATYTVKLKFETSIEFSVESVNAHLNVGFVEPKATIVPAGVNLVTYSSSNLKVATVNESTGEVTFPASSTGTVSITATIPDNEYYMGSTDKYNIIVGNAINAGEQSLTNYQIVSYQDSKYTANTGHKFTVANATPDKKIISGEQFTNVPGIELTFGAYTGQGDVNTGDLDDLGTTWTLGKDNYLAHQTAATYDEETNLPIGGYMAFEPVVSGILTMDLTWYKGQTFVLVDKLTNAIIESYTAGSEYAGEHRFSTPLQAGRTYYLYNKGGKVDGEEVNDVMKFRSASFTPVFIDMNSGAVPSTLADGKVVFKIDGANFYNGTSAVPFLSTANHQHDDITYTVDGSDALNMTADGAFEVLEGMESADGTVTITISARIEAKTAAPNTDTDGNNNNQHSSTAVCQVSYTKTPLAFAKASIDVSLFADNVGADITEPGINYLKDDITYSSGNANAFTVDSNTGNLAVGADPSGQTTITATVDNADITRYYTSNSASYVVNCKNYAHVNLEKTEITMTVGQTGYNILREGCIKILNNDADVLANYYRLGNGDVLYDDPGKRVTYKAAVLDQFLGNGDDGSITKFYVAGDKIVDGKNNGAANTNIVYVSKSFSVDAKTVGTTTVYVNLERIAYSENGNDASPTIGTKYDAVTIPIKVTVIPREFAAENATLRVWDFTKEIDAKTLDAFASENSDYWTYNESDNTVQTSVIKPTEKDKAAYYSEYDNEESGFNKEGFLLAKRAFENKEFSLPVFSETMASEGPKDILKLSTFNLSNYEYYTDADKGKQHNYELNIVTDINLNQKTTIKDNNYMPSVSGSDTNLGVSSEVNYRGIRLMGKASFLHVPNVDDNVSIVMIADHVTTNSDDYINFASSGSKQAGVMVGPNGMKDGSYAEGYNYNRLTNVINYAAQNDTDGNLVAEVAVEPQGGQVDIVSVIAGYIATSGILNKGEGKVPTSTATRTDGYTTVVSPYNIDMTGQKAVKAYICDYYGKENNKVHMKQIRHIPANTPVMLRGYARDMYALFISESNKAVDPGVDESFIKNNRLRGNASEDIYVPLEEEDITSDGTVVKYYNYGLSGSKWVKFGVDGTMKAGKAYLRLTEEEWADLQEAMLSSQNVSATKLSFEFEDLDASDDNVSTGIVQVGTQKDVAGDGYYYSINGVRMGKEKPASKGVYIYNGRKIVIK